MSLTDVTLADARRSALTDVADPADRSVDEQPGMMITHPYRLAAATVLSWVVVTGIVVLLIW